MPLPTPRMICDHTSFKCMAEVRRAPIIVIPPMPPHEDVYKPVRIPTPLHYCEGHRGDFDIQTYLSDKEKARIERACKLVRPADFRPDFDCAFADLVLVTTPEYRKYLLHWGMIKPLKPGQEYGG